MLELFHDPNINRFGSHLSKSAGSLMCVHVYMYMKIHLPAYIHVAVYTVCRMKSKYLCVCVCTFNSVWFYACVSQSATLHRMCVCV